MEIILLESLHKIGKAGEIVTVKDGYANNFLIPNKKQLLPTSRIKKHWTLELLKLTKKMKKKSQLQLKNKSLWRIFLLK